MKSVLGILVATTGVAMSQPATQRMLDMSVEVYGAIPDGGKMKAVSLAGGFIVDSKHVVTYAACCNKTDAGEQKTPFVHTGDKDVKSQVAWSGDGDMVILEISGEARSSGVTLVPANLVQKGQPVFTIQFPDKGDPAVKEGQLRDMVKAEKVPLRVIKASATADSVEKGSAMFDACGDVIGFNMVVENGTQLAFVVDSLSAGFSKTGVRANVASAACSGPGAQESGGQQGGGQQRPPPGDSGGFHLPHGTGWIGFGILVTLALLATRKNTRDQVARVLTQRRPAYQPQAPYPIAPAVPVPTKPALRGLAGQYAGASIPVDACASVMGRDQSAVNLVFGPESDAVSKRHCSIRWDAARVAFVLEDLGSTNGTYIASGERLVPGQPRELRPGDRFYVGDLHNQFEVRME
ncbi:MAG TPA: FHA domain-containing protein [Bryobacteraceae bacterium]|nr:FHA domain-containing protein [Bryobacteraceae bacterium]